MPTPLESFAPGQRVVVSAPNALHRNLAGKRGRVILVNQYGSAWVRVALPQGGTADHCLTPVECSAEVAS